MSPLLILMVIFMNKEQGKEARYAKWRELLAEQAKSGLSQKQFCLKQGIADSTMSTYRAIFKSGPKKTYKKKQSNKPTVTSISIKPKLEDPRLVSTNYKITLPNGFSCDVPMNADLIQLK
jgi:hypothetical protein